eukprot:232609_1
MNVEDYALILEKQGKAPWRKRDDIEGAYTVVDIAFRDDLARGKKVWTGNCCKDFWYFLMTQHSVLSWLPFAPCIGAPKQHPFSRWKRLLILLIGFSWSVAWCLGSDKDQACFPVIQVAYIQYPILKYFQSPFFAVFDTMNRFMCKKIATCPCAPAAGTSRRRLLERLSILFLFIEFCVALYISYMAIAISTETNCNINVFLAVIFSNLDSWFGTDILLIMFLFYIGGCCIKVSYWKEKKRDKKDSEVHIHWTDYQQIIKGKINKKRKDTRGETDTAIQMSALK